MTDGPNETGSFRRQIPPEGHVTLRFEKFSSFVEEYRASISLGGVFIKTHRPRPVGSEVHFEFKLTDGFRLLHGQGVVVWLRAKDRGPDLPAGMGVRFTAIDESGRQLVLKLLEEQVKAGGEPFEVESPPAGTIDDAPVEPADSAAIGEEATLVGTSVQDLNPDLPNPSEIPGPKQAELGFDAPWGKRLPGVPNDLLAEESDPEIEKAVSTIRPTLGVGAEAQDAGPASPAPGAGPASPVPGGGAPRVSAPSVPPVSSNQQSMPVAPPIQQSVGADALDLEEPTLVGTGAAAQAVLPLAAAPEPVAPAPVAPEPVAPAPVAPEPVAPAPVAPEPVAPAPVAPEPVAPAPSKREVSLEDSMMEAADEVEATVELEDPVIDFDPPPEDIDFDPGPASFEAEDGVTTPGEALPTPTFEEPTASELPSFDAPPTEDVLPTFDAPPAAAEMPSFDDPPGAEAPSFDAPAPEAEMPLFDTPAPAAEMPSFDAPATAEMPSLDHAPAAEAPSFDAPPPSAEMPSFDAAPAAEVPSFDDPPPPTAEMPSFDLAPAAEVPSFDDPPPPTAEIPSFDATPAAEAQSFSAPPPAAAMPSSGEPSDEAHVSGAQPMAPLETPAPAALSFDAPTEGASGQGPGLEPSSPAEQAHAADFVDRWPDQEDPTDSWIEGDGEFTPPPRRGAGRRLLVLAAVVLSVAAVYFFRQDLSALVGLGEAAPQPVAQQASKPPGAETKPSEPAPSLLEEEAADPVDPLREEQIDVQPEDGSQSVDDTEPEELAGPIEDEVSTDPPAPQPREPEPSEPPRSVRPEPAPSTEPARAPVRSASFGRSIAGIEAARAGGGTRVTVRFSEPVSSDDFKHDALSWAQDREMVTLFGVENFPQNLVRVGTDELRQIRIGFHPGQELRLVFDLGRPGSAIRDLKVAGSTLEILLQ